MPRRTQDQRLKPVRFKLRGFHPVSRTFPDPSPDKLVSHLMELLPDASYNPHNAEHYGFGLFPVRSPLLGESRLISFPAGT